MPADFREEYFPVYYVEPYQGNEAALGFDLASNPVRLEALNKSRDSGQGVATARITLVQESEDQFGFLVFRPIYRNGFPAETMAQRQENLAGFALGVFRIKDMLEHSLARANGQKGGPVVDIQLYDRSAAPEQQLLFTTVLDNDAAGQAPPRLTFAKAFDVAGRTWELILTSPAAGSSVWSIWQAWTALSGGLLFTGLLSAYLLAAIRRTAAVERLVAARTVELSQSNQQLEQEINERRRTEEALRRSNDHNQGLLEAIPDLMFRLSQDGVFLDYKAAKDEELYAPSEAFIGKVVGEVLPPDIAESCISYVHEALKTGQVQTFEYQLPVGKDMRDFEARAAASGGNEVLLIVRDITARLVVDRMKDEFVSVVSHELRTPLTSIRGSLGLIARGVMGPLPEKAQHMAEIAVSNTDRLINDILDIERMESGKVTMARTACDAAALMAQAAEVTGDMAEEAGVTLSVSPASVQVWADPDRIIQTFTNLVSNAIKFSPRGGTVSLEAQRQGDQVQFQVKDQGRGIPAGSLESIFERFQQVDASDSREKGGTGLGLAICRSIVQQHGGLIWAESTEGAGSTFSLTLPVLREDLLERVIPNGGDEARHGS